MYSASVYCGPGTVITLEIYTAVKTDCVCVCMCVYFCGGGGRIKIHFVIQILIYPGVPEPLAEKTFYSPLHCLDIFQEN